jgi:TetR/AcrR family transcriptional regulator, cholesterol catabolism regulator
MNTPPTRPVLRDRYRRRQQAVLDAAARLFAERGYQASSMADLTQTTGLAAGGLYHYFASKEDILIQICDQLLEPLLARAREIAAEDAPAEQTLKELLRAWLAHVERHRSHLRVFQQERRFIEHQPRWRNVRRARKEFEAILDAALLRCEREGVLAFEDRRLALLALLGMVNHTAQWFRPRGRLTSEQIADGYSELLLHGYASTSA